MRRQVRSCTVFLLLVLFRQRCSRTPMISRSLCPHYLDIKAVKRAVTRYEQIARAKINLDKSEVLRFGAWRGGFPYLGLSAGVVRAGPLIGAKLVGSAGQGRCPGKYLASKGSLKGRTKVCAMYIFPLILCLYFLCLGAVGWRFNNLSPNYFGEAEGQLSVDRSVANVRATGSRYTWFGEPLVRWKTGLPGPILVDGRGVEEKGDEHLSSS